MEPMSNVRALVVEACRELTLAFKRLRRANDQSLRPAIEHIDPVRDAVAELNRTAARQRRSAADNLQIRVVARRCQHQSAVIDGE
jgi:hypothetical protein